MAKNIDNTKTGASSYRELQVANDADYKKEVAKRSQAISAEINSRAASREFDYNENATQNVRSSLYGTSTGWGDSIFDDTNRTYSDNSFEQLQDVRANNEPWYAKIVAGVGKAAVLAGTTAAGTVGLLYGIGQGIYNEIDDDKNTGFIDGIWNNPINQALDAINNAAEEWMPNYYTSYEASHPFTLSANFLGDKIIKNLGFMVGAMYGGMPVSAGIGKLGMLAVKASKGKALTKAAKLVEDAAKITKKIKAAGLKAGLSTEEIMANTAQKLAKKGLDATTRKALYKKSLNTIQNWARGTKATTQLLGSLASAGVEGSIEAISNSNEWAELEHQKLAEQDAIRRAEIVEQYGEGTPETLKLLEEQDKLFEAKSAAIEKEKIRVGNADLLANLPILTVSNWIQFAKLYTRGFKATKSFFGNSNKFSGSLKNADLASKKNWKGAIGKALKNSIVEGNEEYMQRAASEAAGNSAAKSLENYINAKDNYESKWGFCDYVANFGKSLIDNTTNASALEEFTIGAISSMLGMPTFGSHTDTAWIGKGKKFGLSGGLVGEVKDYLSEKAQETKVANYLNARVKDPQFKAMYEGMIAHNRFDQLMSEALKTGDKKGFKDAEFDQLFKDINALAQTGKLDEFKEFIGYNKEYTDEELDDIVKLTTSTVTAEQQKAEDMQRLQMLQNELAISQAIAKDNRKVKEGQAGYEEAQDKKKTLKSNNADIRKQIRALEKKINKNQYSDKQVGPFTRQDGTGLNNNEDGKKEMREILQKNRDSLLKTVDDFLAIREDVNTETGGQLTDEQIETLSYLRAKIQNAEFRSFDIHQQLFGEKGSMQELKNRYQQSLTSVDQRISELENGPKSENQNKKIEDAKKLRDRTQQKLETLDKLGKMGIEELQAALSKPQNWVFFARDLANPLYALDRQKSKNAAQDLIDMTMLAQEKLAYNQKLNEFLQDPNKLNEAYRNAENQVTQEAINKQAEDLSANLSKARNIQDVDALLNDPNIDQRAIDKAFETLESSDNKGLKEMLREYKGLRKTQSTFREILNRKDFPPQIANSILQSVQEIFTKAMSISDEELAKSYSKYKGRTDFVLGEMEKLAKLYEENGQKELANNVRDIIKEFNDSKKVTGEKKKSSTRTQTADPKVEETEKTEKDKEKGEKEKDKNKDKNKNQKGTESKSKKPNKNKEKDGETSTESTESAETQIEEEGEDVSKKSKEEVIKEFEGWLLRKNYEDLENLCNHISNIYELFPLIKEYNDAHKEDGNKIDDFNIIKVLQDVLEYKLERDLQDIKATRIVDNDNSSTESDRSARMRQMQATTYTSGITQYKIDSTHREPYSPQDQLSQIVQQMLTTYKAYSFVERGLLGAIHQGKDENTEVFYLKSTTEGLSSVTFLAIEYDDKANQALQSIYNNSAIPEEAEMNLITLDYNGKKKKFQIIGQLSISGTATPEVQNSYNRLQGLLNDEFQKQQASGKFKDQKFIVSTKYKNKITAINTGRLDQSDTKQSLYSYMSESLQWKYSKDISFGVVQNGETVGIPTDGVPPNSAWAANHNGAVVMYVRKADGQMYPVRCTRRSILEWLNSQANATQTGRDMLERYLETGSASNAYLDSIFSSIRTLMSPNSEFGQKVHAKTLLSKYFILGRTSHITIDAATGEVTLFGQPLNSSNNVEDFLNILAANEVLFTVPSGKFKEGMGRSIVESGIMEIGLSSYDNFNPNFNIQVTDNDGTPSKVGVGIIENLGEQLFGKRNGVNTVTLNGVEYTVTTNINNGTIISITYKNDTVTPITQKEVDSVTAFVYKETCNSIADELPVRVDKEAPEFNYLKNVLVFKNDSGQIIGIYDLNKPTRDRYKDSDGLPSSYKTRMSFALSKYFTRTAKEKAWSWLKRKPKNKTKENIEQQDSSEEEIEEPTEDTTEEAPLQPGISTEETVLEEEETPPTEPLTSPEEEPGTEDITVEPPERSRKSEVLKDKHHYTEIQLEQQENSSFFLSKTLIFSAKTPAKKKLAQQIFEDLQWLEENGYIDLNGEELQAVLDILNDTKNAKERFDKFKTDKTCKG